jgi:ligand-binding sensor domain-containing protein
MNKVLCAFLMLIVVGSACVAQDFWQPTAGPYAGYVSAIVANSSGTLFAATWRGGIFRSTDIGSTWTAVNVGLSIHAISSLTVNSSGAIFAGTAGSGVYRTTDNGGTWVAVNTGIADLEIQGLASGRNGEVFAASYTLGLYRTTNSGASWTLVGASDPAEILQAVIANSNGLVLVGSDLGMSRSTDYGTTWTAPLGTDVQALAFGTSTYVYAGTFSGGVYVSSNSGATWTAYNSGLLFYNIRSLAATSTYVFAGTEWGGMYRSSDLGKSWQTVNIGLTNHLPSAIFPSASGALFAGTFGGGIFRSSDSGGNWFSSTTGVRNAFVYSLVTGLRGNVYAGTGGAGIFRTTDEGTSWSSLAQVLSDGYVQALLSHRSGDIFAGTSNNGVYRSTDNGATWLFPASSIQYLNVTSLAQDSSANIYATTTDGYIFSSSDRGTTWTSAHPTTDILQCIIADPSGRMYAGANNGKIYSRTGSIWGLTSTGLPTSDIYSLLYVSNSVMLAGTSANGVYRSTNSGSSWSAVNTGLGASCVYSLAMTPSGNIYAGTENGVYLSSDNGSSWNGITTGMPPIDVTSLAFSSMGNLYAGTMGVGVYRTVNPVVSLSPVLTTLAASNVATTSATLNGTVALKGTSVTAFFEYGLSPTLASSNQTQSQSITATSGVIVVNASLTGLIPGTTYYFRLVAKTSGGTVSAGDILNFTTPSASLVGSLYVIVKDVDGTTLPTPGGGLVGLFDSGGKQFGSFVALGNDGTVTFTNVPAGSGYSYQVWHNPGTLFGQAYWGSTSGISITANSTTSSSFVRNQPIVAGLKVYNGTTDVTGQTVAAGSVLRLELTIRNPNTSPLDVRGRFVVDRDKNPPFDIDTLGATFHSIAGGNLRFVDSVTCRPTLTGDYYAVAAVQIFGLGGPVQTDGMVWAATKSFTVGTSSLAAPVLSSPADGATGVSTTPSFTWNAVTGALSYQLQISTISTFQTADFDKPGISGTSFQPTPLANSTKYYWRVGAVGTSSAPVWSIPWSFTTAGLAPVITNTGTTKLGATTATLTGSVNPSGAATDVWFEWGTTSALTSSNKTTTQSIGYGSTDVTFTDSLSSLTSNSTYYYRVGARNSAGTQYGSTYSFVTLPAATTPSAPANNATGQAISPTLLWTAQTPVTYHVQVSVNPACTAPYVLEDTTVTSNSRTLNNLAANTTYYWRVRAKGAGGYGVWSAIFSFSTLVTKSVVSPGVSFPSNPSASTDYRLVSFPGSSNLTVGQVLTGAQNTDWKIFRDNGAAEPNHLAELSSSSAIIPGEGYWLVTKGTYSFSSSPTMPRLGSDGTYTITVRSGWNIIGNPFDVPLLWNTVKTDNSSTATLWTYAGTAGYQSSATLDPFKGFYFNSTGTTLKLRYPFPAMSTAPVPLPAEDWRVQIALETESNLDLENYVGMAPAAREALDDLDQCKPPRFLDQASLSFSIHGANGTEQSLSSDFRPNDGEGQSWNVSVVNPKLSKGMMKILGVERIPAGLDVVLIDPQNTTPIDLRAKNEVPFRTSAARQTFTLLVGTKEFIQNKQAQLIPKEFGLSQNYPNPFNPSTTITYTVPREAAVRLEIISVLGQEVELLAQGTHAPGTYSVTWGAVDRRIASGVYFARLSVEGKVIRTLKMMLLK